MDITIHPRKLQGKLDIIPSKSQAHRYLICAAFADSPTHLICPASNQDIEATAACLQALGAGIIRSSEGYLVTPVTSPPETATLPCGESGSTLRFLLPVAGALGVDATFQMEGRLPERPLSPLWEEMERMGCTLTRPTADTLRCQGKLSPGRYRIDGSVSSQFITGLLLALSLLAEKSELTVTGKIESVPYIRMSEDALAQFGASIHTLGGQSLRSPGTLTVEGDWSNGAFFLAANALGSTVDICGLQEGSSQGDRAAATLIPALISGIPTISAANIPDLVPILAVTAAANQGAVFTDIRRLRLKESDRVASVISMIGHLGGIAYADENTLTVPGTGLSGGTVDACNDHRIAMAAAIAATACKEPVTILGAQAVKKSYPQFWEEYRRLGGYYEQYLW